MPVKCMWTEDSSRIKDAGGVWFHIPTFGGCLSAEAGSKVYRHVDGGDGYYPKLKGSLRARVCVCVLGLFVRALLVFALAFPAFASFVCFAHSMCVFCVCVFCRQGVYGAV